MKYSIALTLPSDLDTPSSPQGGSKSFRRWNRVTRRNAIVALICSSIAVTTVIFNLPQYPTIPSAPQPLPASLVEYQNYLKEYYSDPYPLYSKSVFSINRPEQPLTPVLIRVNNNETDWYFHHQRWMLFHGNVDDIQKWKGVVKMNDIGSLNGRKKAAKFVLIEGGPGMGKSTLCWQLCRLWREGKLQWDLMVIVRISDKYIRKASNLYDLLHHHDDKARRVIAQDIWKREGEGLLIFLDGYDEISKEQQSEFSVFQEILRNQFLHKATVVVTSRPLAATTMLTAEFKRGLDQHIEIAGFNDTDIQTYITSASKNNRHLSKNFRFYLSSHPSILSVMYNPLYCTILTELFIQYWQNERKVSTPITLTELHSALIMNIIKHNLLSNQVKNIPNYVKKSMMQLSQLAAKGLFQKGYIYSDVTYNTLGLMVSVNQLYDIRTEQPTLHMFQHISFQEYLSAVYWSTHPDQLPKELMSPLKPISQGQRTDSQLSWENVCIRWPLYLYLAGLTKLKVFHPNVLVPDKILNASLLCELLFEAQSPQKVIAVFSNRTVNIHSSSLDWYVLGYCITNSDHTSTWVVNISHREQLQTLSDGMSYSIVDPSQWTEKNGPTVRVHLTERVGKISGIFPCQYFPSVCSQQQDLN